MNKLKKILPFVAAALILAVAYFGIDGAQRLLPDYKGELEEAQLPRGFSAFTLDGSGDSPLWPWDRYASETVQPDSVYIDPYYYTDDIVNVMLSSFINHESEPDYNFSSLLERSYNVYQGSMHYLKDITFAYDNGLSYVLNLAFSSDEIVYYSCISREFAAFDKTIEADALSESYKAVRADYEEFRKLYENNQQETRLQYDADMMIESDDDYFNFYNSFYKFMASIGEAAEKCNELDMWVPFDDILYLITEGANTGVTYSDGIIRVEFSDPDYELTLFYSPMSREFAGYSLRPRDYM